MSTRTSITLTLTFDEGRNLTRVECPRCKETLITVVKLDEPHHTKHDEMACIAGIPSWHPEECKRKWFR